MAAWPPVGAGWSGTAGYAKVQLGDCRGRFINMIDDGPSFVWRDGERTDALPWDQAIQRFGRPRLLI